MSRMRDQVLFITGASSGIGAALALEGARQGAKVALLARREDKLRQVAQAVEESGGQAMYAVCDVTNTGDLDRAVAVCLERWGRIDVVMANAGFGIRGFVEQLSVEEFQRQFDTNFFAVIRTLRATLAALKKSEGCFGVVGSANGSIHLPKWAAYCTSKASVRSLCACLRHELAAEKVSVTHLAPGFVASEFRLRDSHGRLRSNRKDPIPSLLVMPAEVAARKMLDAVLRRKREQVITLHARFAMSLERHLPWLANRLVALSSRRVHMLIRD